MTHYLDSSVVLRILFGEPQPLAEWSKIERAVTSVLTRVECSRVIAREARRLSLGESIITERSGAMHQVLDGIDEIDLSRPILSRASLAFPVSLKTLDALHLATALAFSDTHEGDIVIATHDHSFAEAARGLGLHVIGA